MIASRVKIASCPPSTATCTSWHLKSCKSVIFGSPAASLKSRTSVPLGLSTRGGRVGRGSLRTWAMFEDQSVEPKKEPEPEPVGAIEEEVELPPGVLFQAFSGANIVRVIEIPQDAGVELAGAKIMLLDTTNNIHSIYKEGTSLFGSYWDVLAAFPPLLPAEGVLGWYGMGAGTAPRAVCEFFPEREQLGWELDPAVLQAGRELMGLGDLEARTPPVVVKEADVFDEDSVVDDGFAGLVIDLFAFGKLLPKLKEADIWRLFQSRLRPGGRLMINLGGGEDPTLAEDANDTLKAMREVFDVVYVKSMEGMSANQIAIAGETDFEQWKDALPEPMKSSAMDWVSFES